MHVPGLADHLQELVGVGEAQRKAGALAQYRIKRNMHYPVPDPDSPGEYFPLSTGVHEGCAWSGDPDVELLHLIELCCDWGVRTPFAIGIAQGDDGWYACVSYSD